MPEWKGKKYLAMKVHSGHVRLPLSDLPGSPEVQLELPDGAIGMLFIFKTKKAAHAFWGKDVGLKEMRLINV